MDKDLLLVSSPTSNEKENLQYADFANIEEGNIWKDSNVLITSSFEQKFDKFIRFVVWKLTNFEVKLNTLEGNQKTVLDKLSISKSKSQQEDKEKIDIFTKLPLKDENNLTIMETKLKNDSCYRNEMVKQLTRVTCENARSSSLRLIKTVLSNELAEKYSWYGAKKKEIFSQLEICKVIMNIMRKTHANITDEQIAAPIKIWLSHAKERMRKNEEKYMERTAKETNEKEDVEDID